MPNVPGAIDQSAAEFVSAPLPCAVSRCAVLAVAVVPTALQPTAAAGAVVASQVPVHDEIHCEPSELMLATKAADGVAPVRANGTASTMAAFLSSARTTSPKAIDGVAPMSHAPG